MSEEVFWSKLVGDTDQMSMHLRVHITSLQKLIDEKRLTVILRSLAMVNEDFVTRPVNWRTNVLHRGEASLRKYFREHDKEQLYKLQ